ncbi:signal peptidase complex subunit 3 [Marmota marmota marmota]|uniref:signal peptidase complex subunit 3 n=1 Tax=Marmota marmota marmota TaxID=9994 RepID=UPI002091FC47|nr:signal peptidase complex subunit 3 [Marmota marmota marmota]
MSTDDYTAVSVPSGTVMPDHTLERHSCGQLGRHNALSHLDGIHPPLEKLSDELVMGMQKTSGFITQELEEGDAPFLETDTFSQYSAGVDQEEEKERLEGRSHRRGAADGAVPPARKNVEDFTGPRERSDLGFITFDITADLENIFDWNVKQLFLYLSAEYSTKNNALNQVVLWDKIVLRGDNPKLLLKDMKTKYFFFDDGNGLKGNRNVTLTLSWNVVPNAGILPLVTGSGHVSVPFPDTYEITKSY